MPRAASVDRACFADAISLRTGWLAHPLFYWSVGIRLSLAFTSHWALRSVALPASDSPSVV